MPHVKLSKKEAEEMFHAALCNGAGQMAGYGFSLDYDSDEYAAAREKLESPCREDVWLQILKDGGSLKFIDSEGDYTTKITIKDVHEKVEKTPFEHLNDMLNEQDDAITADVIIQSVLFGEVIFG